MGKNKSCDPSTRKTILKFYGNGWSYRKIADHLGCSKDMVMNAIRHLKNFNTTENVPRKTRPRKTTPREDSRIVLLAKREPFNGSELIRSEIFGEERLRGVSARTIRRRLCEANLFGRISRKVPLLKKENIQATLVFAKKHEHWTEREWKNVLYSDETKINMITSDGKMYVIRPPKKEMDPKYTKKTVKHGGGNIKVWGCFSGHGIGPIKKIEGNMDKLQYKNILEEVMLPYAEESLPVVWPFQHDHDPKHTAKVVKEFLRSQSVAVLDWPPYSPDINPIENLWFRVKKIVASKRTTSVHQLYAAFKEAWEQISIATCNKLIASMPRRCRAVIAAKGHATKY
ncbi:unnamed protein product [Parnassius mnemosyne]|uniref:Transposase n=1 Tax=Parnassius mnemosyne TaxID=213953 RepID=A0AAV1L2S0_9NEOP